ncbi:MAG: endo-1,4-beta-xylanase [Candidatus Omnitrophica bacterium]|nr:endo-1,4-beta-xylanase [Candidatus Omnitrophota bacterium]
MIKKILLILIIFSVCLPNTFLGAQEHFDTDSIPSLKTLAEARGKYIGTAVDIRSLKYDPECSQVLADQFNVITPANALKFDATEPGRNIFSFKDADAILNFATIHNMKMRGHTLVWYLQIPSWLAKGKHSKEDLKEILHNHIKSVVGRYKGKIYSWDVVNEAFQSNGTLRRNVWLNNIGAEYIELAFRWAHEADPNALLFYNEDGIEMRNKKSDAVYELIKKLKAKGVPIDGIGFEGHFDLAPEGTMKNMAANIKRFAELGLETDFTEVDVTLAENILRKKFYKIIPNGKNILDALIQKKILLDISLTKVRLRYHINNIENAVRNIAGEDFDKVWAILKQSYINSPTINKEKKLEKQAKIFNDVCTVCLNNPSCKIIIFWGFTDKHSWLRRFHNDDAPLILDQQYHPKPAYYKIIKAFQNKESN